MSEEVQRGVYPTNDPVRNAYGEIMYWADLRLSQQYHAQQCNDTCEKINAKTDPEHDHAAGCCYIGEDLLMAAEIVAKQGGFEKEHEQHRIEMIARYWGDRDAPGRWGRSPWDAYGRAGMGLSPVLGHLTGDGVPNERLPGSFR